MQCLFFIKYSFIFILTFVSLFANQYLIFDHILFILLNMFKVILDNLLVSYCFQMKPDSNASENVNISKKNIHQILDGPSWSTCPTA